MLRQYSRYLIFDVLEVHNFILAKYWTDNFEMVKEIKVIESFLLTITAQIIVRHVYETHEFYKVSSNDKSEWGDGVIEERWEVSLSER